MSLLTTTIEQAKRLLPDRLKRHLKMTLGVPNAESSLLNMRYNGFNPQIVIDVGAYAGDWTRMCKHLFPKARVLMIEPQETKKTDIQRILDKYEEVELATVLVGPTTQSNVGFYELGSASSVLPEIVKNDLPSTYLSMTTLDAITENTQFAHPDFLKLDVQGYELEVLKGGTRVLSSVEAVFMEVNLLGLHQDVPLCHEVVAFMADHEFQIYDVCTLIRRPFDGALWQMDVIFVRSSSALVSSKRWA